MRITFLLSVASLSGGVRVVATYARLLQQRGHTVAIVSIPARKPTLRERLRRLFRTGGWYGPVPPTGSHVDGSGVDHRILDHHRPIVEADVPDADVIVATWWETAEWMSGFSDRKGAKVYFLQGYEVYDWLPSDRVRATWRLPMHKIVVAKWLADIAEKEYGQTDVSLVPNSVDHDEFDAPPRGKQSVPTVGLMYSHLALKGCDIAIEAYRLAREQLPQLKMRAFGTPAISSSLPLPSSAEYVRQPSRETLRQIYAGCDAWLFASRHEGFGLPILEAMACRTPVIGTPAGAAPDLLADGGGVLPDGYDPQAMAEAIVSVCSMDEPSWRRMSDEAHQAARRCSWEDMTDLFEAALRKAVVEADH